jgi:hypothetical protein
MRAGIYGQDVKMSGPDYYRLSTAVCTGLARTAIPVYFTAKIALSSGLRGEAGLVQAFSLLPIGSESARLHRGAR